MTCSASELQCDNGLCVLDLFQCDGDDDCLDNTDERGCSGGEGCSGWTGGKGEMTRWFWNGVVGGSGLAS